MIFVGPLLSRKVFMVFGAIGVNGYLFHLAYRVFADSLLFPFVLTLLGFGIVAIGIFWQRHEDEINATLRTFLPQPLQELAER